MRFQRSHEFAAKHLRGCSDRDEETAAAFAKFQITGKTGTGNDAVYMGMKRKVLPPRMEHQDDARRSAKIAFVASQSQKRLRSSLHEQRIQEFPVSQKQRIQIVRHGEYEVEVFRIENFAAALIDPEFLQDGLAVRTMPVAAGRTVDLDVAAFFTDAGIESEPAGLAVADRKSSTTLLIGDRMLPEEIIKGQSEDIPDRIRLTHRTPAGIRWGWYTGEESHWTDSHRR